MSAPISPAPVTDHRPDYLPAYLSNGAIGLRVREISLRNGVAVVDTCRRGSGGAQDARPTLPIPSEATCDLGAPGSPICRAVPALWTNAMILLRGEAQPLRVRHRGRGSAHERADVL